MCARRCERGRDRAHAWSCERGRARGEGQSLLVDVLVVPPAEPVEADDDPVEAEPELLADVLLPLGAESPADVLLSLLALSLLVLLVLEPESVL